MPSTALLIDPPIHPRLRLAGLWASRMFCFIYGDYFELYRPGKLASMSNGHIGAWAVSQQVLLGTTALMLIPCLMTAATLLLPATIARVGNSVVGVAYAAVIALAIQDTWAFYVVFGVVEIVLCAGIVSLAVRWPRTTSGTDATSLSTPS